MKYLLVILTVLFAGCMGTKEVPIAPKKELPVWYTNPPASNNTTLYALGEGKDKQEAVANALNYLASTLSVSIESSYKAKTKVREGSINASEAQYNSELSADVKKIRISNYAVEQEKSFGFQRYAVLIRSDKEQIFASLQQELDQNRALFEAKEKNLSQSNGLQNYIFYKKMKEEFAGINNTLIVLGVLHSGFDSKKYIEMLQKIDEKFVYYKSGITFSIRSNIKGLNEPIAKALSEKEFHISKKNASMHYTIVLDAQVTQANAYGFILARTQLQLTTKDAKGRVVGSNMIHLTGQSSQSYDVAIQDLSRQLNDAIQKEGIAKIINLDI